jgi:hypothetical protein
MTDLTPARSWPPPQAVERHTNPSTIIFLPYASGSMTVRRIVEQLVDGQYEFHFPDIERWQGRNVAACYPIEANGSVYIFTDAVHAEDSIRAARLAPSDLRYVVCLRDPRDMLVSLYFLSRSTEHLALHTDYAVYDQLRAHMEEARAVSVDDYALSRVDWAYGLLDALRVFLSNIPVGNIRHLSYAALCHAFPSYLRGLVECLGAKPTRQLIAQLLATEDIQRPLTLNSESLARFPKASPRPGRHRKDLSEQTTLALARAFEDILGWMADNDLPAFAGQYTTQVI